MFTSPQTLRIQISRQLPQQSLIIYCWEAPIKYLKGPFYVFQNINIHAMYTLHPVVQNLRMEKTRFVQNSRNWINLNATHVMFSSINFPINFMKKMPAASHKWTKMLYCSENEDKKWIIWQTKCTAQFTVKSRRKIPRDSSPRFGIHMSWKHAKKNKKRNHAHLFR